MRNGKHVATEVPAAYTWKMLEIGRCVGKDPGGIA